jgi:hypothetical protein
MPEVFPLALLLHEDSTMPAFGAHTQNIPAIDFQILTLGNSFEQNV